ncbi:MAG: nucleotidyl transferase AbiEii/AbiGii toxin family protein [Cyclobacteriaceae bacterium]
MHTNTVSQNVLALLKLLMQDENLSDFRLVGGTALSLQIGHRMSVDIDLFTTSEFDKPQLSKYLTATHHFRLPVFSDFALHGFIGNVKVDLVHYNNGFLNSPIIGEGIRMADLEDIAAMKLEAISNVQNRLKDYVDVAFMSSHLSLKEMLACFKTKFDYDESLVIRSLGVFSEIQHAEDVFLMKGKFEWRKIKERILAMINNPSLTFKSI